MLDLNGTTRRKDAIVELIDKGIQAARSKAPKRNYLGASLIGEECERVLQFHYFNVPVDPGKETEGRILRIFDRGNDHEERMIHYLRGAGFDLRTRDSKGRQYEFSLLDGKIKGHCDGVIVAGPAVMQYPALWENKCLGCKYWKQLEKEHLRKYSPVYYGQVQIMQAYFELDENPALFTAVNADTEEIYVELVPFDAEAAQKVSDRAVRVIKSCDAGELLPRVSNDPTFFKCKWCAWNERCFSL